METITQILARELGQKEEYVENIVKLLDDGNTVPFIARYRKEMHGTMDDQTIRQLADRLTYLRGLDARRDEVREAIEAQGKLTDELSAAIAAAQTLAALDDLYRPYRPKRRTRASMAREKGLAPLADALLAARGPSPTAEELAQPYVNAEKGLENAEAALAGAGDIIAEDLSDDAALRGRLRALLHRTGILRTAGCDETDTVYTMYHDFSEPVRRLQSHRVLAINRGEKEGKLKVTLETDETEALATIIRAAVHPKNPYAPFLREVCSDSWKRLLFPSLERELRSELTDAADEQAIHTFALNLRPLLMQPPVRGRVTLGFDPGYRNGCKLAVVDETGKVLDTAVIYPYPAAQKNRGQQAHAAPSCATDTRSPALPSATARHPKRAKSSSLISSANTAAASTIWLCPKRARRSTRPPRSVQRNFRILTSTCVPRCPSRAVCRTRWLNWSKSTPSRLVWANTSTICRRRAYPTRSTV